MTVGLADDAVLLGTVAIEPNRWGLRSPDRRPLAVVADWLDPAREAGFDGVELWENHATMASEDDVAALAGSGLPVPVFNSYASFEDEDDAARDAARGWMERLGATAIKYNVGNDPAEADRYGARLARFVDALPDATAAICECHRGSAADDPAVAARILAAAGPPEKSQALVHLGEDDAYLDAMFDALGDRIRHVHVNFLNHGNPPLAELGDDLARRVEALRARGFRGSWTLEFVTGVGSETDEPGPMVETAVRELAVLRGALSG